MSQRDYYEILGVSRSATEDELKRAYRRVAIQHHPDKNPGDSNAEALFKQANEAYQILGDPQRRAQYDRFGHAGVSGQGSAGFSGNFSDIFDGIFGDIFGRSSGGPSSGTDLRYQLEITFEEAAFGAEKTIKFEKDVTCDTCQGSGARSGSHPKTCTHCQGSGQVRFNQGFFSVARACPSCQGRGAIIEDKCSTCRGNGQTRAPHTVEVKIPAGIDSNQRLRVRGEGEISEPGGSPGDLYVQIHVAEHTLFKREGEHVILDLPITFPQAAMGAEVDIPTLGGKAALKIPAGTQFGATLKLKNKGIKRLNGSGHGDQYVRIIIETPSHVSGKQKDLLKQLDALNSESSHPGIAKFVKVLKEWLP